jgi:hypothetical protein
MKVLFRGGAQRPHFAVEGRYAGTVCGATYGAFEPAIRLRMTPNTRADLPVAAHAAIRQVNWYVHKELEALCEMDHVTDKGCDSISARQLHCLQVRICLIEERRKKGSA